MHNLVAFARGCFGVRKPLLLRDGKRPVTHRDRRRRWLSSRICDCRNSAREALVDDPEFLREIVEVTLDRLLDTEITEHLQAGPCEGSEMRTGYRYGYRSRRLKTRVGTHTLAVPMDREGSFRTLLFERYQRTSDAAAGAWSAPARLERGPTAHVGRRCPFARSAHERLGVCEAPAGVRPR